MIWKFFSACALIWVGAPMAQNAGAAAPELATPAPDTLTLEDALSLALKKHPGLDANRSAISAREAGYSQVSLGMNPEIALDVEDVAGTGAHKGLEAAQTTVQVSQTLEWGGKRGRRKGVAAIEIRQAEKDLDRKRMDVRAQTRGYFMEALNAQRRRSLALESKVLSDRLLETVTRRVKEGAASMADELRAHLAVTEAGMEIRQSTLRLEAAKRKLALLWGEEGSLPPLRDELDSLKDLPPLQVLFRKIESGPVAATQAINVSLAEAKLDQQQGLSRPDITFNGGLRHIADPGDLALVAGVSMPLPLRNRNQGGRVEAKHDLERAKAEQRAAVLEAKAVLGDIHRSLLLSKDEIETLRGSMIPDAEKAAGVLEEGYRRGRFGMLEVLNSESELFRHRLRYLESLLKYQLGFAELERLIGTGD